MTKAPIRNRMRALLIQVFLQDVVTTLSNQNQLITHGGGGGVCNRAIQLPARPSDVTVATDGLGEA